jgi:hypothetical protein
LFSPGQSIGHGSHRRSKSSASRTSTTTVTTNTEFRFSQRSNSTATQATSVYDEGGNTSTKIPRKLLKSRTLSPGPGFLSGSESDASPKRRASRAVSRGRVQPVESEGEEGLGNPDATFSLPVDASEDDLSMRLELARKNSLNQSTGPGADRRPTRRQPLSNPPVEPIYEGE